MTLKHGSGLRMEYRIISDLRVNGLGLIKFALRDWYYSSRVREQNIFQPRSAFNHPRPAPIDPRAKGRNESGDGFHSNHRNQRASKGKVQRGTGEIKKGTRRWITCGKPSHSRGSDYFHFTKQISLSNSLSRGVSRKTQGSEPQKENCRSRVGEDPRSLSRSKEFNTSHYHKETKGTGPTSREILTAQQQLVADPCTFLRPRSSPFRFATSAAIIFIIRYRLQRRNLLLKLSLVPRGSFLIL